MATTTTTTTTTITPSYQQLYANLINRHRLSTKLRNKIDSFIEQLSQRVGELNDLPANNLEHHVASLGSVKFPINDQAFKIAASFLFRAPNGVQVVGSYRLGCATREQPQQQQHLSLANDVQLAKYVIDLVVEIPKECWQKKDHLNYVYHRKRALYLAIIAAHLQSYKEQIDSVQFQYQHGDHLKPTLVITPTGRLATSCQFNLTAVPVNDKSFIFSKFALDKCNIQIDLFDSHVPFIASPVYNSSILADLMVNNFADTLHDQFDSLTNIQETLLLLRLWLEQRSLRKWFAHIITVFVSYLLQKRQLNSILSASQQFQAVLQAIVNSAWNSEGIFYNVQNEYNDESLDSTKQLLGQYRDHFEVVFVETVSGLNLAHRITIDLYERLKHEAKLALSILNQRSQPKNCALLFSSPVEFNHYFDYYINVSTDCIRNGFFQSQSSYYDCGFNAIAVFVHKLIDLIKKAVGDRITLVQHKDFGLHSAWSVQSPPPSKSTNIEYVTFGLLIAPDKAYEPLTKGPLANQPEAKEFREFWGEKSEIRRFQNGEIREAVYWGTESASKKRAIIDEAIKYILNRKLHIKMKLITSTFNYLDSLLELNAIKFDQPNLVYDTGEHFMSAVNEQMVTLKKYLHSLSISSVNIVDVIGIDPIFRSTEVFPPFPINVKPKNVKNFCNQFSDEDIDSIDDKLKYIKPIEVNIKVETDEKLVRDREVMFNQKYLLHYELGKVLAKTHNLFVRPTCEYVDVFFAGYVFRLYVLLNNELSLLRQLEQQQQQAAATSNKNTAELDRLEFRQNVLPAISGSLNAISKECLTYSITCRLFKRWLSLKMIRHYYEEVTLDLLVAYALLHYEPHCPQPCSPLTGFNRVLKFIAQFDFTENALILNFNQSLSLERVAEIEENFANERAKFPPIFLVTPYDNELSHHTRFSPSMLILHHTRKLAAATYAELSASIAQFRMSDLKNHLRPSLSMFDMVIELNTKAILNKIQAVDFPSSISIKQSLYTEELRHAMPITDFNPVKNFMNTLQCAYTNLALFFYDQYGGRHIGVLLRPEATQPKPFKYSSIEASALTDTSYTHSVDYVALNVNALMEDFTILGDGLVEKVRLQSDKWLTRVN